MKRALVARNLPRKSQASKPSRITAHPVLASPGDREFDALPVDNMEAQSYQVALLTSRLDHATAAFETYFLNIHMITEITTLTNRQVARGK